MWQFPSSQPYVRKLAHLKKACKPKKVDLIGMNSESRARGATVRQNKHINVK